MQRIPMDNSPGRPTPASPVAKAVGRIELADKPLVIAFHVPAVPVAQPRQRHAVIAGHVANYTPTKHPVNAFKATVRMAAKAAYCGPALDGELSVEVTFLLPRPSRLIWKTRPMPREPHLAKPDIDNLLKSLKDALTGTLWTDDCRVFRYGHVSKWYAAGDEQPHVEVTIREE